MERGGAEGGGGGGAQSGEGRSVPAAEPGGITGGGEEAEQMEGAHDYGRFGVGDDEGAAEGGFKGARVTQAGRRVDEQGEGGEGGEEGLSEAVRMGRAAGKAMAGGEHRCAQGGEVSGWVGGGWVLVMLSRVDAKRLVTRSLILPIAPPLLHRRLTTTHPLTSTHKQIHHHTQVGLPERFPGDNA